MRAILLLAVAIAAVGCVYGGPTTAPDVEPDSTHATIEHNRYVMTFAIERTTLRPGDTIVGTATLRFKGVGATPVSGSGAGILAFSFQEVGGQGRSVTWIKTSDCAPYTIDDTNPIVSAIVKSGGVSGEEDDAAFKRWFLDDPLVRLPPGEWDITANAAFTDGAMCQAEHETMNATVRVRVTE